MEETKKQQGARQKLHQSVEQEATCPLILTPKKLKGNDGYKVFSIRVKEDLVEKIDYISSKTGHSRNELIGIFLNYAIKNCTIDESDS